MNTRVEKYSEYRKERIGSQNDVQKVETNGHQNVSSNKMEALKKLEKTKLAVIISGICIVILILVIILVILVNK